MARRVAEMSHATEHQKYSIENQSEAIRKYAAQRQLEIVRTYADEGRSGLNIGGRDGLKRLIADVRKSLRQMLTLPALSRPDLAARRGLPQRELAEGMGFEPTIRL